MVDDSGYKLNSDREKDEFNRRYLLAPITNKD
jgi:hypothetical protein